MEENTPINADIVNVPTNGASAGMVEGTEATAGYTQRLLSSTDTSKPKRSFFDYIKIGLRAYAASLVESLPVVPIVASAVTLGLYFSTPISTAPSWYPVVFGMLYTYIAWWVIALPMSYLTTVQTSNPRSYGLLITRLRQLEARLKEIEAQSLDGKPRQLATYQLVALREAHNNFEDLNTLLYKYPSGLQWVLYMGYINAWGKLHRAEEALIEVEPVEMVIRGALHDKLAIQDSNLSSRDELLKKMRQAAKELYPAMESRFRPNRPVEDSEEIHKLKKDLKQIADKVGIDVDDDISDKNIENQVISVEAEARARLTLREIRRTLNEFRDRLWEGLVRARNNLLATIFSAGLVTHILLIIFILSSIPTQSEFLAAAVYYMVGAAFGLAGRIYREAQISTAVDDYGLSFARLVATPLLSGLAGIGGVFLFSTILAEPNPISITNIFALNRPDLIIAAAFFGLTPNLLIRGLQQRAEKYMSALKNSKGAVEETPDNAN
jgi:hypothetical protein